MKIDNGRTVRLSIAGVFEGEAFVSGPMVSFVPNLFAAQPDAVHGGLIDGVAVMLTTAKDAAGPFWTARFRVIA